MLSYRIRLLLKIYIHLFLYLIIWRGVFAAIYPWVFHGTTATEILNAIYLGLKFDARFVSFAIIPLIIASLTLNRLIWGRGIFILVGLLVFFFINLSLVIDIGAFSYLKVRLNAGLLELLQNLAISLQMMWETYPVIPISCGMILVLWFGFWRLSKLIDRNGDKRIGRPAISWFIFAIILGGTIYGKVAYYPLRWSEAFFSTKTYLSQFTLNPVLYFFDTYKFREKTFNPEKVHHYYPLMASFFQVDENERAKESLLRARAPMFPLAPGEAPPNVVMIVLESLCANKSSMFNNPMNATPHLQSLVSESLFFDHFFTPTESTARSIFASVTGLPDVIESNSSSRNPLTVNQHSIINEFKNYEKFYFLGGSANWGNIRGIFTNNVDNIHIYEESSFSSDRNDVWGISDLDLFIEAHAVLEKEKKPFFAFIQSAGFHRPYTIPEKNLGFISRKVPKSEIEKWGIESDEELNSLAFQDHAMGHFFKLAKKSPYYQNTIFVVFGDHGLPTGRSENLPKGYSSLYLTSQHVPFVIHYPKKLAPGVNKRVVSQLDVLPTLASLAGVPYRTRSLGRDIFSLTEADTEGAFVYVWHTKPYKIGWVDKEFYYVDFAGKQSLHKYESDDPDKDWSAEYPDKVIQLKDLSNAFWEYSKYLRYNNPKLIQ